MSEVESACVATRHARFSGLGVWLACGKNGGYSMHPMAQPHNRPVEDPWVGVMPLGGLTCTGCHTANGSRAADTSVPAQQSAARLCTCPYLQRNP